MLSAATALFTMAHLFAKLFILMLADFFTPLFNYASHSSLLSGNLNYRPRAEKPVRAHLARDLPHHA
jgi:hypothetical protein